MKTILMLLVGLLLTATAFADNGEKLFKNKACVACHHATKDQRGIGLGVSIKQIKDAYKSDKKKLVKFLRGKLQPIIDKQKYDLLMKSQVNVTKNMPKAQLDALASFLLK